MPILTGLFRLGRDAELRHTESGDAIINLSFAYNYGRRDGEGKKPTQWVDAALWGKKAEALEQYLIKGSSWECTLEEVRIEEFKRGDGTPGAKLTGRVALIDFASPKPQAADGGQQQRGAAPAPPARTATGASALQQARADLESDDIPF